MLDLITAAFQVAAEDVGEDEPAAEPQVGRAIQARPARIHRDLARRHRFELLHVSAQRVVEAQRLGRGLGDEQRGGKVTLAAVGQQGHDGAVAQGLRFVQGDFHGRPGAHPHENPLFPSQPAGGRVRRIVVDVDDRV